MRLLTEAAQTDAREDIEGPAWAPIREMLATLSTSRARQGFSPTETATFVFSFKQPLFAALREKYKQDAEGLARDLVDRHDCSSTSWASSPPRPSRRAAKR